MFRIPWTAKVDIKKVLQWINKGRELLVNCTAGTYEIQILTSTSDCRRECQRRRRIFWLHSINQWTGIHPVDKL